MATVFPFNYVNRRGIPLLESNAVTVNTDNVSIALPNNAFRFLNDKGILLFRLNSAIPAGTTTTLPIVFSVNNFTQSLTNVGGTAITVAQLPGTGVYSIYYDKTANLMQLLTGLIPT